jgi:hypothetical protein
MSINPKLRFEIFKKHNFTCQYCGRKTPEIVLELDHIIPRSKGGTDNEDNLTTSCWECNRGKGASLLTTILKDENIHDKTVMLLEREIQLREYNYVLQQIKEREQVELEKVESYFYSNLNYVSSGAFPENAVKKALKVLSYFDILEHIDSAVARIQNSQRELDCSYSTAVGRYLAGILWNQIRRCDESNNAT